MSTLILRQCLTKWQIFRAMPADPLICIICSSATKRVDRYAINLFPKCIYIALEKFHILPSYLHNVNAKYWFKTVIIFPWKVPAIKMKSYYTLWHFSFRSTNIGAVFKELLLNKEIKTVQIKNKICLGYSFKNF